MSLDIETIVRRIMTLCRFFESYGELTTCKRKPVGCGVFTLDCNHVPAIAHNGPPAGLPVDRCKGDDPCGCGHSEPVAMTRLNIRDWNPMELLIYTSAAPCLKCALAVIASRRIKFWLFKPTWYTTKILDTVVRKAGIMPIPVDILERILPRDEWSEYEEETKNPDMYSRRQISGAFLQHARTFYGDNFPYYHDERGDS